MPPKNRSVHSVSKEMGVGEITIHRWISQIKDGTLNLEQDEENPRGQRNMIEKSIEHARNWFADFIHWYNFEVLNEDKKSA